MIDNDQLGGNLVNFVNIVNNSFAQLNSEKLKPLNNFTEFKKSLKSNETDTKSIDGAIQEVTKFMA